MAKPNYAFQRRQREIAKKQKQEEKRRRKTGTADTEPQTADPQSPPVPPTPADDTQAT